MTQSVELVRGALSELQISRTVGDYKEVQVNLDTALVFLTSALREAGLPNTLRARLVKIQEHLQQAKRYFGANDLIRGYNEVRKAALTPIPPS